MSTRKTTFFYAVLIAVASLAVGMVIASRLELTPESSAQTISVPPMNSAPLAGPLTAETFRDIAKAQSPMVVNITAEVPQRSSEAPDMFGGGGAPDDLLRRFFGERADPEPPPSRPRREQKSYATGTGFIIDRNGLILTNNHVVENATKIEVSLYAEDSDVKYEAQLVGRDQLTDSALIQLVDKPDHALPEAKFGDSSQMAAGDWVVAIGNPFNYSYTVTVGVISATKRAFAVTDGRFNDMLQTDAAINPGNSGGPLLNVRGEVVGINTAIISNGRTEGNIGIGFAVPINTVRDLLPQLRRGKVVRGRIGVQIAAVPRDGFEEFGLKSRSGALVAAVTPGGAAERAGIQPGDVILQYNGRPIADRDELVAAVVATTPGTSVPVQVMRDKRTQTLTVVVEELDLEAEQGGQRRQGDAPDQQAEQGSSGFGLTLQNLTPQIARRLNVPSGRTGALVSDVDPGGPSAAVLRAGDVILEVNRKPVSNAAEAGRALQEIASGRIAQVLIWRDPSEVFVTVKKD
ncbi:MAG: Do family serine endopeptidase [Acidobacteria bacterium]|nr:Do family serine endopeptidase [Acidobacteriota bacterium]